MIDDRIATPGEAILRVNEKVKVEMRVKATKNRLQKRKEIYIDSEEDFRAPKNLGIVVNELGAARFREIGIEDPADHFKGKAIRVTGILTKEKNRARVIVEDPKQIQIVESRLDG